MDKLEYLNCEGCEHLSDNAFKFLLLSSTLSLKNIKSQSCLSNPSTLCTYEDIEGGSGQLQDFCKDCSTKQSIEDLSLAGSSTQSESYFSDISNSLKSINLSGCWSLSDYGLR